MVKIAIIGYSGSGKTTLARTLAERYGVEALHLDGVQFKAGWESRPQQEQAALVEAFLNSHDGWVIDGNYSGLAYERRMQEADRIILLLFNRFSSLYRVTKRYRRYRHTARPEIPGCPEKLDWEFIRWVLKDGRSKRARQRYQNVAKTYAEKAVILRNQRQLHQYLSRPDC